MFNWLYAKKMGGKFLLRIEDTDQARNTPEAVAAIHGGLAWLRLTSSEPTVLQSSRQARHVEVAMELLHSQDAYLDNGAIRVKGIKGPQTINDLVQGEVTWPQDIDDFVILRSDGTPTYMLAVVVDDYDMGVTHVIRGDDHLNNAFRQNSIYKAMGWRLPTYGHIPLIFDENGKKLSKRTGAAAVEDYRDDMGILPEAMLNYLARLGWGHGNDEVFSMEEAAEWFDIKDVNRNPARLDKKKLLNLNGQYIRKIEPHHLALKLLQRFKARGIDPAYDTLVGAMSILRERSADLNALVDGAMFLWAHRPIAIEEKARAKIQPMVLSDVRAMLAFQVWDKDIIEAAVKQYAEISSWKLGDVAAALRAALTGSTVSPPIFETMILLGKDETLLRLKDAII